MLSTVPLIAVNLLLIARRALSHRKAFQLVLVAPSREKTQRTNSISHKRTEEPSHRRGITESGGWLGKLSGGLSVRHVARILTITPLSPHRQYCTNTILQTDNTPSTLIILHTTDTVAILHTGHTLWFAFCEHPIQHILVFMTQ